MKHNFGDRVLYAIHMGTGECRQDAIYVMEEDEHDQLKVQDAI